MCRYILRCKLYTNVIVVDAKEFLRPSTYMASFISSGFSLWSRHATEKDQGPLHLNAVTAGRATWATSIYSHGKFQPGRPGWNQNVACVTDRQNRRYIYYELRSLRSIVTSFQVTSFQVTSFHLTVTSFHKQIVGNYKVVMLCCCAILIANTTCLDMLFKLTFLSIKLYSSTVIFIVGRFVADRSCLTFFNCLPAMCENFLSPAPK